MKTYQFDADDAVLYGVECAVMLWNLKYWIEKNSANNKNFHEGRYWTYNSRIAFTKIFPWWSSGQIKRILKSLQDKGVIVKGEFNKNAYDRTSWYGLSDEYIELTLSTGRNRPINQSKSTNQLDEIDQPIPDNKPNNKQDRLYTEEFTLNLSDDINPDLWNEWMRLRMRKKAENSERAINALLSRLTACKEAGMPRNRSIEIALEEGWKSIRPDWIKDDIVVKTKEQWPGQHAGVRRNAI